jgi:hypothetical protein
MPGEQEKVIAVERAGKSKMKQDFGGGFVREFAQWLRFWSQRLPLKGA